jgi:UDP-N-acetylmuramoyl-tripeptide--D-alanyl-D-alanine ligase
MATPIPRNQATFSVAEILEATSVTLVSAGDPGAGERTTEVSTDTRSLGPGALFVALRGETFDAHDHLDAAIQAGAKVLVVERDVKVPRGVTVVHVGSTLAALGALGRAHARRWRALGGVRWTIAITGSAGKTTTRVATQALLERLHPGEVHATKGNLNNLVGAPMVLFGLRPEHRYAVIEIGMSVPGEIEALARMVEPDAGLVTLVAAAHVEAVGSIEGVAHEKGALFRALREDGVAIGNGDNRFVREQIEASSARTRVLYGAAEGAAVHIAGREPAGMTQSRVHIDAGGEALDLVVPLLGDAGAYACAAAITAVTRGLGERVSADDANAAFAAAEVGGGAGRLVPVSIGGDIVVIDDSYNANPASMRASIRAASEIARAERRRLVLVLGEMRELGAMAASGHEEVGRAALESGAALVIAAGTLAAHVTAQLLGSAITHVHVSTAADAAVFAQKWAQPSDLVLVKGSRGIGTDLVVRALREHFGSTSAGEAGGAHGAGEHP